MWLLILAVVVLFFSATFGSYLAEAYTTSFQIATFAKATSMVLFFAGIAMLFIAMGWKIGLAGIVGYWVVFALWRVYWHTRLWKNR